MIQNHVDLLPGKAYVAPTRSTAAATETAAATYDPAPARGFPTSWWLVRIHHCNSSLLFTVRLACPARNAVKCYSGHGQKSRDENATMTRNTLRY